MTFAVVAGLGSGDNLCRKAFGPTSIGLKLPHSQTSDPPMSNVTTASRLFKSFGRITVRASSRRSFTSPWAYRQQLAAGGRKWSYESENTEWQPAPDTTKPSRPPQSTAPEVLFPPEQNVDKPTIPPQPPSTALSSKPSTWTPLPPTPDIAEPLVPEDRFGQRTGYSPLTNIDFEQKWKLNFGEWTIPALYEELRIAASKGLSNMVHNIVRHLINERKEKADLSIYRALMLCNVNPEGSVASVMEVLKEIENEGLQLDVYACHDVLRVLAVHPDYLLQTEILGIMKDRWFELSVEGWHDVAAGLLRSLQFEMALGRIDEMQERGMPVRPWLYDMAIYILAEAGELDEVQRLLQIRAELKEPVVTACLWNFVLDTAGEALHYDLISFVWNRRVKHGYLNPASGVCFNVLNAAARKGDAELATDVFRVLGERNTVFEPLHYEMLVEAYANAGDLNSAFKILNVMQDSHIFPDDNTIRAIVVYMHKDAARPQQGFDALKQDIDNHPNRKVPAAAVNACIEGALFHGQLELAVEFYKTMHVLCRNGANTSTFNLLMKGCSSAGRKDLAMSLVKEMLSQRVRPDQLTYDRLILVCLSEDDYEDAVRYYHEMRSQGYLPRNGTLVSLVKTMARAGDSRTENFLDEIERMGISTKRLRVWLQDNGVALR